MIYEDVESNGQIKRNYTIIAGDTFPATITILKDNNVVLPEMIQSLKFKLSDTDYNAIYEQDFEYNLDYNKWYLSIPSEQTKSIGVGTYIYEYELTMTSGYVRTIMQAKFKIKNEIKGE